jgi:AcrR family transcriptional regulator
MRSSPIDEASTREDAGASPCRPPRGQRAETRKRILSAARPIFLRHGLAEANLNDVARAAGVGKGTLYRHFASKGELYVAVLSEHGERFIEELRDVLDPEAPALVQIEQLGRFYLDFWLRHPAHFEIVWAMQKVDLVGPLSPTLLAHVRTFFERPIRLLEQLLRAGIERGELRTCDPWNTANAIAIAGNALVGQVVGSLKSPVQRDPRAVFEQLLELTLAGLARPREPRG